MATLHDRILKRVQNWNSLADPMEGGGFEFAGNVDRVIQSVDQSALARRICFEGQSYKLEMLAGFGRLHQVRVTMDGRKPIDFTFEASDSEDDTNAKVAEFNGVIADLALEMRGEAPVFEFLNYHFADGGVPSKAIKSFGAQDTDEDEADTEAEAKAATDQKVDVATAPASANSSDEPVEGRTRADNFLDKASKHSDQAVYFSDKRAGDLDACNCSLGRIQSDALSIVGDWHENTKTALGEEVVIVGIPKQGDECYAFALTADKKVGVEFKKRNLAQICRVASAP